METINSASVEILNDLIQINNDRIAGYQRAIDEAKEGDSDLKTLFASMIQESQQYRQELTEQITALGGNIDTGTTNSGKIYRAWMDVKAMFTGSDRKSVLENCEFGEDAAQKAYNTALAPDSSLAVNCKELVMRQQMSLKASHDKIKALRNAEK